MPTVIPVKFKYAARDLWFNPKNTGAQEADHVICATERGTEIGIATGDAREVTDQTLKETIGNAHLSNVIRIATDSDLALADTLARKGDEALPVFRKLVAESGLDMKPVGVEYTFGGEKVVCYFAAEERVDFRQLVRDLSHALHQRIDMRQIGVREEAAIVGGYGHCGQELCCRRFGLAFEPVSIRMAKEQDLPLNSSKISGACGRLMCCLRYEFEAYRDFKSRAPKRNAVIDTPLGKAKIVEYDTPKEEICLRIENGKQVRIPLAEMVPSDAAKKKSQELGCPCRPDTVLRSSLDKLNSPDVQMALAELDRKNGVKPPETFDDSDLFVDTKARSKRRARKASQAQEQGAQEQQGNKRRQRRQRGEQAEASQQQGQGTHTRRRHRRTDESVEEVLREDVTQRNERGEADAGSGSKASGPKGGAESPNQGNRRRRGEAAGSTNGKPQTERQHGMRKRRHHKTAGAGTEQDRGRQAKGRQPRGGNGPQSGGPGNGESRNGNGGQRSNGSQHSGGNSQHGGNGQRGGNTPNGQHSGNNGGAQTSGASRSGGTPKHMRHPGDRGGSNPTGSSRPGAGPEGDPRPRRRRRRAPGGGGSEPGGSPNPGGNGGNSGE
ncbi:MAG: regulatory iron-sulfur-containing complex subunit RicT [Coriobacteriales bacterium]|nr:regulatory iron-sulfur-containing complex subunit RicT [Coriobacteriales bacterium]